MAEKSAKTTLPATLPARPDLVQWKKASKPNFMKLIEGEQVEGIFLGCGTSQFGVCYRFSGEGGVVFTLGGKRAQLDQIFTELMGNPEGFIGDTIIGHRLAIRRLSNVLSKTGRKVGVFEVGHVVENCPKQCSRAS